MEAQTTDPIANTAPADIAQGPENVIRLAKGARVILRANLRTAKG